MLAYVLQNAADAALKTVHYASEVHLQQIADNRGLGRIVYWPADAPRFVVYCGADSGSPPLLIAACGGASATTLRPPAPALLAELCVWLVAHHAEAAHAPVRMECLGAHPNTGSARDAGDIALWCDGHTDDLTRFAVLLGAATGNKRPRGDSGNHQSGHGERPTDIDAARGGGRTPAAAKPVPRWPRPPASSVVAPRIIHHPPPPAAAAAAWRRQRGVGRGGGGARLRGAPHRAVAC